MSEHAATTVAGTVGHVFRNADEAESGARRLRAAGFPDVRLSEGAGTTTEAHVPESAGLTASDFATTLENAGFSAHDARRLTDAVARGGTLVTLAAGSNVERALAVLRGETVPAQTLTPVDLTPAATAVPSPAAAPVSTETRLPSGSATGERTLELREEQLDIQKQRTYGEARVRKETVTEQQTITVPVQRERLVVERDGEDPLHIPISGDP